MSLQRFPFPWEKCLGLTLLGHLVILRSLGDARSTALTCALPPSCTPSRSTFPGITKLLFRSELTCHLLRQAQLSRAALLHPFGLGSLSPFGAHCPHAGDVPGEPRVWSAEVTQ